MPEITSWQLELLPLQAPLKPEKLYPVAATAVRVTLVPALKLAEQVLGQFIPGGWLVTVPLPDTETVSWPAAGVNVADTDWLPAITSWQAEPLHAPPKAEKLYPDAGDAVRVTVVPALKLAEHAPGQLMPAGWLVTVPLPVTETVNWGVDAGVKVADTD